MSHQHPGHVHNPQDKLAYCKESEVTEAFFIEMMNAHSHLTVMKNPAKEKPKVGIYAPDLWVPGWGLCDLKAQKTPFFSSMSSSCVQPNKAVTFNRKDLERYDKLYDSIGIFFWVNWLTLTYKKFRPVNYRWGVYFISLDDIKEIINSNVSGNHTYKDRQEANANHQLASMGMNREGNATDSWVLSVDWMKPVIASHDNPWNFQ